MGIFCPKFSKWQISIVLIFTKFLVPRHAEVREKCGPVSKAGQAGNKAIPGGDYVTVVLGVTMSSCHVPPSTRGQKCQADAFCPIFRGGVWEAL